MAFPVFGGCSLASIVLQNLTCGNFFVGALCIGVHRFTDFDMWHFLLSDIARIVQRVFQVLSCGILVVLAASRFVLTVLQILTCGITAIGA